jgi:Mn-dependent DtxR family transcriptional regulator
VSEDFLRKFYEITGREYKVYEKYKAGQEMGLADKETEEIVEDLCKMGFIKKIRDNKILITFEGKETVNKSNND